MTWIETPLGFQQNFENHLIFFGKKNTSLNDIQHCFPHLKIKTLHQTHSDICVSSDSTQNTEHFADAHFATEKNIALLIKTADCLPIMAFDPTQEKILAIHAGWRGVENQITSKSFQAAQLSSGHVFIGPHILQQSFEVDTDVKDQLMKKYLGTNPDVVQAQGNKYFIKLDEIVLNELSSLKLNFKVNSLALDTVTDLRFNSYRRDKSQSGRNLSFIARL